ncbi:MAG: polyprenyl synthetase family protein [Desulfobacteraceae bacterium]|nr:polyprenyl synthetase family protein [Pseudomonadota bacterium]MCG2755441.1 polyprenyl synthetase family protein [Desulfobacteraceae bacterium]
MSDLKNKILASVKEDLEDIEIALKQNLKPYLDLVSQTASHILFAGGKRLRPLLMVLSARICGYKMNSDKTFSIMFEYLHAATLLHDDLVDEATLRRGKPVAHSIWGNSIAVLVGDFLLARALSIAADIGRLNIIKIISEITENMSQGEIHQLMKKGQPDLSEEEYMEIIQNKTAILFKGACQVSAVIADAPEREEKAISNYGFNLGIAFQMTDDLLDYTSNAGILGKEAGADLKEGKLTLPLIYALKRADSKDRAMMERIIKNKDFSADEFKILLELLHKYKGLKYTEELAAKHIAKAKEALVGVFKPSGTRETLINIADYALARKY